MLLKTLLGTEIIPVAGSAKGVQAATVDLIAAGGEGKGGTFTANGTSPVIVANAGLGAGSVVVITLQTPGGVVGAVPRIQTVTPGTGFTVLADSGDSSTYNYQIIGGPSVTSQGNPIVSGVVGLAGGVGSVAIGQTLGAAVQWFAQDGSPVTPSAQSLWQSSNPAVLGVTPSGLQSATVLGNTAGSATLTATDPVSGVTATSAAIVVSDSITSGTIIPSTLSPNAGDIITASVVWRGIHGAVIVPLVQSTWVSSNPTSLTVTPTGLETASGACNTGGLGVRLQATDPTTGVVATSDPINIADPITRIFLARSPATVNVLGTGTITATCQGHAGNTIVPSVPLVWASSNNGNLSVASTGLATATYTGQAASSGTTMTATDPTTGVVSVTSGAVTVLDPIVSGTIGIISQTLTVGDVDPATVTWFGAKGNTLTPGLTSVWDTSNHTDLTVASTGLQAANVTAVAAGTGINLTATDPTTSVVATLAMTVVAAGANPNAAQFVTNTIQSISSLDTGRVGYFVGWGSPQEFGYAYTYSLTGAPSGVTIDSDMGILSIGTPLAAGSYTFHVVVTNRENPGNANSFLYTLTVLQGVTSGRTGTQVLHRTYDPHSGAFGTPPAAGGDWTAILQNIKSSILADQTTQGEMNLRATIPFHKGVTYNYTNNDLLTGVQFYDVTATGSGAAPILRNNGSGTVYQGGPLNIGNSGAMNRGGSRKANSAAIATVAAGATSVTCSTHAQVSRLIPGRWHCVIGQAIQVAGEPPNLMFLDWVIVTAVNASTGVVTLDRPLKYAYQSDWWENPADDISFGKGYIYPADTDSNGRMTLRGRFYGINFQPNPGSDHSGIMLLQSHLQSDFDNCTIQNFQVTLGKHYGVFNNSAIVEGSEPDKQSETLFFDGSFTSELGGATGFTYFLARNTSFVNGGGANTVQISPRQFRAINCTFNALASTTGPYTWSFNGPNWYTDFESSTFTGTSSTGWTFTGNPFSPLTIGTGGTWSTNRLQIPTSSPNFEAWLINSYIGAIVAVSGLGPITTNWGYVNNVSSDGAGGALYLDITWVDGVKPTSGTIDIVAGRFRRLLMNSPTFAGAVTYANARMAKQTVTGQTSWGFPAGYPSQYAT